MMALFVDRHQELAFLERMLARAQPQLLLMYGRRRVGKTSLLRRFAELTSLPHFYWAAEKEPAPLQRRKLFATLFGTAPVHAHFQDWASCFVAMADVLKARRSLLILDELPYAADGDPSFLSALQHAWDQHFKQTQTILLLCGSQVNLMERLLNLQSPLYGRFTGQWHLKPLPFRALSAFGPDWTAEERVAIYATVGGVPAYLEWLDPSLSFADNMRDVLLASGSMFTAEPELLLYDEVREPRNYLALLKAIGGGAHTLAELHRITLIEKTNISAYLARLQELYLVERRVPVTVPPHLRHQVRSGRYHLSDPYFRFYFRFLAPRAVELTYRPESVYSGIREQLRAFVGVSAWEGLAKEWTWARGRRGQLAFMPDDVGSHWSPKVQVDVVAVQWAEKRLFLGECKWQPDEIGCQPLKELVELKGPKVIQDLGKTGLAGGWSVTHGFFARGGFTTEARQYAWDQEVELISLERLDRELSQVGSWPAI